MNRQEHVETSQKLLEGSTQPIQIEMLKHDSSFEIQPSEKAVTQLNQAKSKSCNTSQVLTQLKSKTVTQQEKFYKSKKMLKHIKKL